MEISGKSLREVEFRDRLRGYDTDEVDEFLEKVAVAVDDLRIELQRLAARAEHAEKAERPDKRQDDVEALDDDSIRRTLVLAQRTADMAIKEANEEASRVVEEARSEAGALVAQAEDHSRRVRDEAEQELTARVDRLNGQRERLENQVQSLARLLEAERNRLSAGLTSALRFVEERVGLSEEALAVASAEPQSQEPPDNEPARSATSGTAQPEPEPEPMDVEAQIAEDAASARSAPRAAGQAEGSPGDPDEELWARWTQGVDLGVVPDPDDASHPDDPFGFDRPRGGGFSA